jgi:hypothetical protein
MGGGDPMCVDQLLHPNRLLQDNWVNAMPRWPGAGWRYPSSHLLKADVRQFFDDPIPLDQQFTDVFHGFEYRLGLIQQHRQGSGAYQAFSGEYVGENGWSWGDDEAPFAELSFRKDLTDRARAEPWDRFLEVDQDRDEILSAHREVLKHYRRFR